MVNIHHNKCGVNEILLNENTHNLYCILKKINELLFQGFNPLIRSVIHPIRFVLVKNHSLTFIHKFLKLEQDKTKMKNKPNIPN